MDIKKMLVDHVTMAQALASINAQQAVRGRFVLEASA